MKKNSYERCLELVQNWRDSSIVTERDLRALKRQFSYSAKCTGSEQEKLQEVITKAVNKYKIYITREHEQKGLNWCRKIASQGNKCKIWGGNYSDDIDAFKTEVKNFKEFQFEGVDIEWQPYWRKYCFKAWRWGMGNVGYSYGSWQNGSRIRIWERLSAPSFNFYREGEGK